MMPLCVSDRPERLIPVVPNDVLLRLVKNCNIAIDARVRQAGWEYINIEFWKEDSEQSIVLGWTP